MINFRILLFRYSSILLWIFTGSLMLYGTLRYSELNKNVSDLRRERVLLSTQIDNLRFERDQASTNIILLLNSATGLQDHAKKIGRVLDDNCAKEYEIRCARWLKYGNMLVSLQDAISERVKAQTSDDFETVGQMYRLVFDQIDHVDWLRNEDRSHWEAISKEGIAYSALRGGRLKEADVTIKEAQAKYPNSGIVGSTYLKVSCALNESNRNFNAQNEFDKLNISLQERENSTHDPQEKRNANFNRRLFSSDREITRFCHVHL